MSIFFSHHFIGLVRRLFACTAFGWRSSSAGPSDRNPGNRQHGCSLHSWRWTPRAKHSRPIAEEGFIYGLPLVMKLCGDVMSMVRRQKLVANSKGASTRCRNLHGLYPIGYSCPFTAKQRIAPYSSWWLDLASRTLVESPYRPSRTAITA